MKQPIELAAAESALAKSSSYPKRVPLPLYVAPAAGKGINTTQPALTPVACWQINSPGFDLDSSFLIPEMRPEIVRFAKLVERHPKAPISIFGHADAQGDDEYNKWLAGRRAAAVFALLVRDVEIWHAIYRTHIQNGGDIWGMRQVQAMLGTVSSPIGAPFYDGPRDGAATPKTMDALRAFQSSRGLPPNAHVDAPTLKPLFRAYMDALCTDPETGQSLELGPQDFLGGGEDKNGKAAYQSCGEFNPTIILSAKDAAVRSAQAEAFAKNRRVVVYMFEPGTRIPARSWPCPTTAEGAAGCRKRFWSDGEKRRQPSAASRTFDGTQDTFACRFYQRIATDSPCEMPSNARTSLDLYLDLEIAPDDARTRYSLISHDGTYAKSLSGSSAVQVRASLFAVRFTMVVPGKRYTLIKELPDGASYPIFADVPFDRVGGEPGQDTE